MNDIELMKNYINVINEASGSALMSFLKTAVKNGETDDILNKAINYFKELGQPLTTKQISDVPKIVQNITPKPKGLATTGTKDIATAGGKSPATTTTGTSPNSPATTSAGGPKDPKLVGSGDSAGNPPGMKRIGSDIPTKTTPASGSALKTAAKVGAAAGLGAIGLSGIDQPDTGTSSKETSTTSQKQPSTPTVRKLTSQEEMELNALAFDIEKNINKNPEYAKMLEPYYKIYGKD